MLSGNTSWSPSPRWWKSTITAAAEAISATGSSIRLAIPVGVAYRRPRQVGPGNATTPAAGGYADTSFTRPTAFADANTVIMTAVAASALAGYGQSVTGFTIRATNTGATAGP
jgi:hypothetical protein